uniref:Uncharacterized protein n=1 Tax=Rousettus aegyptiacus TaxID=9407 RepID=A0A7J8KAD9_ROUAE|nr:hypothetical protein HJG63_007720 [Rousettus aegyptiacus]
MPAWSPESPKRGCAPPEITRENLENASTRKTNQLTHAPRLPALGDTLRWQGRVPARAFTCLRCSCTAGSVCTSVSPSRHASPPPRAEARPQAPGSPGVCCPRTENGARAAAELGRGGPDFLLASRWPPCTLAGAEPRG